MKLTIAMTMGLLAVGCAETASTPAKLGQGDQAPARQSGSLVVGDLTQGAVYVQGDNPVGGNKVYAFSRDASGALAYVNAFATGGYGSGLGDPNSGDHAVLLDDNLLFVTNAGSNSLLDLNGSVSVLAVGPSSLTLLDVKSTGGLQPLTVARRGNVVVTVNNDDSIQTFTLTASHHLVPAAHTVLNTDLLHGGTAAHPADVVFSKAGNQIIVAERQLPASLGLPDNAWFIDVATIDPVSGALSNIVRNNVAALGGVGNLAAEPFALQIGASGSLVVTHGRFEIPNGSYEASYTVNADNTLTRTSLVPSGGFDDCWSTIVNSNTPGLQFYYEQSFFDSAIRVASLTNTLGSFTLAGISSASGLQVPGGIDLGATPSEGPGPVFLYALNGAPALPDAAPKLRAFAVDRSSGALTPLGFYGAGTLPPFAVGLAVR